MPFWDSGTLVHPVKVSRDPGSPPFHIESPCRHNISVCTNEFSIVDCEYGSTVVVVVLEIVRVPDFSGEWDDEKDDEEDKPKTLGVLPCQAKNTTNPRHRRFIVYYITIAV